MSYSVEWIDPIFDRTSGDVLVLKLNSTIDNTKGCYNATDLNRIENDTKYVAEDMYARRIVRIPFSLSYKLNWQSNDVPTREDMLRIIQNISILMENCNPVVEKDLHKIYNAAQITYALANDLEYNLNVLKNQPELPVQTFLLTIEHGIIQDYDNPDWIPEEEIVTIQGVPYGESAQYMVFDHWSGSPEDLACLDNTESQTTTIEMPYRNVTLEAVFTIRFPRTLTLTNAVINDEIGGSTRIVFAGDEIPILANVADYGKRMYCWEGTPQAIDLIHGGDEPSTSVLTMPDMDVQLQPKYINAGQHKVTITDTNGTTVISENWYEYGDYVTISAPYKGVKYSFAAWSGDTSYLDDITDSNVSFSMPDVNIRFTPTYNYVYGRHYVLAADNCLVNNEIQLNNYMESSQIQMSLTSEYSSTLDDTTRFDYYQVYEMTNIVTDPITGEITSYNTTPKYRALLDTPNGRITMPDYDVYIAAVDSTAHTLTVSNINNTGNIATYKNLHDRKVQLSTSSVIGQYVLDGWYRNNSKVSDSTSIEYTFGNADDTLEVRYIYTEYHTVTVVNKNDLGATETHQVLDGFELAINTTEIVGNDIIDKWYFDHSSVGTMEGKTTWKAKVYNDVYIEIAYRARETYTITVQNGEIQGGGTTYTGLERTTCTIVADAPANKKYFSGWSTISGSVYSYGNSSQSTTTVQVGRSNAVVQATYGDLYNLTVNTSDGVSLQGQYRNGTKVSMPSSTMANVDTEWDKWDIASGIMNILNIFNMTSDAYTGNQDTVVNATYKEIPYFTCTIQNGHFSDNSTTKQIKRNSSPTIIMDPAPFGMKFLMWEIVVGNDNDISAPLAETSSLYNVTHPITVKATYYVPDDSIKYTMSVTNKNGVTTTTQHSVGEEIQITADSPDTGYEFYRWIGDTSYLTDRYSTTTVVRMPNKNISLGMLYRLEGTTILYHVSLSGGTMIIGEQGGEPVWDVDGEFAEGSVVQIKADAIPTGWKFNGWRNNDDNGASMSTVDDLMSTETFLTVSTFDITLTRDIILEDNYAITVNNGETSGSYLPGAPVSIYFNKESDDNNIKYTFTRWTGDTNLSLAGGGNFDINDSGDFGDDPQIISMPQRNVTITGEYSTSYKVNITNGTINSQSSAFLEENDTGTIQANTVQGRVFQKWEGDTSCVSAIYNATTTVTMPNRSISLVAKYIDQNDQNGIGYVLTNEYNNDTINIENINIISGTIQVGFMFTDIHGHIYVIIALDNNTANIARITKKTGGTENG